MGSFSVSCGITKLTITCGDRCLLLPLIIPETFGCGDNDEKNYACVNSTHMFLYNTDMWEPFCFPIRGEYNDYGSLENIVKDKNTEIIEKYLGIKIEDFIALITDGRRDVYDRFSCFSKIFLNNPEDLDYDVPLDVFFMNLGFEKTDDGFKLENKCFIKIVDNNNFKAVINGEEKDYCYYNKCDFLKDYFESTKEYLGISEENLKKLFLINKISGMFMLEEAYDFYSKNNLLAAENIFNKFDFHPLLLLENGFETKDNKKFKKIVNGIEVVVNYKGEYDKDINKKHFYNTDDFIEIYKELTGKDFECLKYNGMDTFDWQEYIQSKVGFENIKNQLSVEAEIFNLGQDVNWDDIDSIFNFINNSPRMFLTILNIESFIPYSYLLKELKSIKNLYLKEILNGEIISYYTEFRRFFKAMDISNIMFAPTFCGTQCGSRQAEIKLTYITNKIVNNRENMFKEDEEDYYKQINPMHGFDDRYY